MKEQHRQEARKKEPGLKEPGRSGQGMSVKARLEGRSNARSLLGCLLALLLGGGLLPQAQAAELKFNLDTTRLVLAEEINFGFFDPGPPAGVGPGLRVFGENNPPTIILTFTSGTFPDGTTGRITYRLFGVDRASGQNPGFGQHVTSSDWTVSSMADTFNIVRDDILRPRGRSGENGVRADVTRTGDNVAEDVNGISITLTLPGLRNLHLLEAGDQLRVRIGLENRPEGAEGNFPDFSVNEGLDSNLEDGHTIMDDVVLELANAVQLSATDAATLTISADDDMPARFPSSAAVEDIEDESGDDRQGLDLGSLGITLNSEARQADGTLFVLTAEDTLTITLTSTGGFAGNAIVFLDLDGDMEVDTDESFDLSGADTMAELELAGNSAAATALVSATGERKVYLVPDGSTDIITSDYSLGMELDYGAAILHDEDEVATEVVAVTAAVILVDRDVEFELDTGAPQLLAQEVFGTRSEALALPGERSITLAVQEGSGVGSLASATLEYRLSDGLQFGADLAAGNLLAMSNTQLDITLMAGGQQGDSSVTYQVVAGDFGSEPALRQRDELVLRLPSLQIAGSPADGAELGVQVFITPLDMATNHNFQMLNPLTDGENGNSIENSVLVEVRNVITPTATNEVDSVPASTTTLTEFADAATTDGVFSITLSTIIETIRRDGIRLGQLRLTSANLGDSAAAIKTEDGTTDFALTENDRVRIRVSGPHLDDYELAFIDSEGERIVDSIENIPLTEDGMAFPGTHAVVTALLGEDTAPSVYLVPDGMSDIITGTYSATMTVDYADAGYGDEMVTTPDLSVQGTVLAERDVEFELDTGGPQLLAQEVFGTRSEALALPGERSITLAVQRGSGVGSAASATLEYRLSDGLQFGANLAAGNLTATGDVQHTITLMAGGQQGDSSVTYRVVTGTSEDPTLSRGDELVLRLPSLQIDGSPADGAELGVQVFITPGDMVASDYNFQTLNPLTDGENGNSIENSVLVEVRNVITSTATNDVTSVAASETTPTEFADAATTDGVFSITLADGGGNRDGIRLGELRLTSANLGDSAAAIKTEDGTTDFDITENDEVRIRVSGTRLGDYALAFIDVNGNGEVDSGEEISLTDDTVADGDLVIALLGDAALSVYLVPDGTTDIVSGTYSVTLEVDYTDAGYQDEESATTPDLSIDGIVLAERDVEFELDTGDPQLLALEVFGTRSEALALPSERSITLAVQEGSGVGEQASATLEYRLDDGLQFGANLAANNLTMTSDADNNTITLMSGGQQGDSSVVYQVVTGTASGDPTLRLDDELVLTLPALQIDGSPADGAELGVQVFITPGDMVASDFNFQTLNPLTDGENGNSIENSVLVEVRNVITSTATNDVTSVAASETTPTLFDGTGSPPGLFTIELADATIRVVIRLGLVQISSENAGASGAGITAEDGTTVFAITGSDNVRLRVNGPRLGNYALAFVDTDGDGTVDSDEEISLTTAADLPASVVNALVGDTARPVYLVPDGTTDIISGTYSVTLMVDYEDAGYRDEESVTTPGLSVTGITTTERNAEFQLETTAREPALELFGAGSADLVLGGSQTVTLSLLENSGVTRGAAGTIEYRLDDGLRFAGSPLNASNLRFNRPEGDDSDIRLSLASGGQPGDGRVVFRITTGEPGDVDDVALTGGDELILTLAGLQLSGSPQDGAEFRVQVRVEPVTATGGGFNFPVLAPLTDDEQGNQIASDVLVRVGRQFTLRREAADAIPMLAMEARNRFVSGAKDFQLPGGGTGQAVSLGSLGVTQPTSTFKGADGRTDFALAAADRFLITLLGADLPEGVLAFIDLDGNIALDTGETISPDGLELSGTSEGAMGLLGGLRPVYLVTDGEALLEPVSYNAELALDFANEDYLDAESVRTPTVTIAIEGILPQAFAYAIPNCTQVERGNIHLINETNRPLTLFMQGRDQAGTNLGMVALDASLVRGSGQPELQPEESLDLLTEQVEQLFSLNDGGFVRGNLCTPADTWHGRAQLTFLANGNLTVVPQIRGSRGELRDIGGFSGLSVGEERVGR